MKTSKQLGLIKLENNESQSLKFFFQSFVILKHRIDVWKALERNLFDVSLPFSKRDFCLLVKGFNSPRYPELSHKVEKLSTKSIFVTGTNAECKTDLPVLIGKLI